MDTDEQNTVAREDQTYDGSRGDRNAVVNPGRTVICVVEENEDTVVSSCRMRIDP